LIVFYRRWKHPDIITIHIVTTAISSILKYTSFFYTNPTLILILLYLLCESVDMYSPIHGVNVVNGVNGINVVNDRYIIKRGAVSTPLV